MSRSLKRKIHNILELSNPGDRIGRAVDIFMICLIITNVIAIVLESEEAMRHAYGDFFYNFEEISVAIFTIEYILRVWSCTVDRAAGYSHPIFGRLKYMRTPIAIIDLLAFAPFYIHAFYAIDLRILRIFRLLRLLKLTRYSPALNIIWVVMVAQRRALSAWLLIMSMALMFSSSIVYLFEHKVQPERFGSIPDTMWWAITTLSTTGYGDAVPVTPWGRVLGALTMIMGVCMVALPAGVIASGFVDEIKKRDFVVNWRLVSSVPLFSLLDAAQIADIVTLLTPLVVPPNHAIVRIGEEADTMYFIISGQVEIETYPKPIYLKAGEFFGEIGLIEQRKRTAAVIAMTQCHLLELKAVDFWELADRHPSLRENITAVAKAREAELESAEHHVKF